MDKESWSKESKTERERENSSSKDSRRGREKESSSSSRDSRREGESSSSRDSRRERENSSSRDGRRKEKDKDPKETSSAKKELSRKSSSHSATSTGSVLSATPPSPNSRSQAAARKKKKKRLSASLDSLDKTQNNSLANAPKTLRVVKGKSYEVIDRDAVASRIVTSIATQFPAFSKAWRAADKDEKDRCVKGIVGELALYQVLILQEKARKDKESHETAAKRMAKKKNEITFSSNLMLSDASQRAKLRRNESESQLVKIMQANNPSDWGGGTIKGFGRFTAKWRKKSKKPTLDTIEKSSKYVELSSKVSNAMTSLIEMIIEVAKGDADVFDEKREGLATCVEKCKSSFKRVVDRLRSFFPEIEESSTLFKALTSTYSRIATLGPRGDIKEVDGEIIRHENYLYLFIKNLRDVLLQSSTKLTRNTTQLLTDMQSMTREYLHDGREASALHMLALLDRETIGIKGALDDFETLRYLSLQENVSEEEVEVVRAGITPRVNIWDEPEEPPSVKLSSEGIFRPGTLNHLILRVTDPQNHQDVYLSTFLAMYKQFTTPCEVLDKLIERYQVPPGKMNDQERHLLKLTVARVIHRWVIYGYLDFDVKMVQKLKNFCIQHIQKDTDENFALRIMHDLESRLDALKNEKITTTMNISISTLTQSVLPVDIFTSNHYEDVTIAQQLTLIEYEIYSRIEHIEFQDSAWNSSKRSNFARNVIALIQRANRVSFWVATTILLAHKLKDRVRVLSKIIGVAKALKDLNNFNTLMGFIAGLNVTAVSRLSATFGSLGRKQHETLKQVRKCNTTYISHIFFFPPVAGPCKSWLLI